MILPTIEKSSTQHNYYTQITYFNSIVASFLIAGFVHPTSLIVRIVFWGDSCISIPLKEEMNRMYENQSLNFDSVEFWNFVVRLIYNSTNIKEKMDD